MCVCEGQIYLFCLSAASTGLQYLLLQEQSQCQVQALLTAQAGQQVREQGQLPVLWNVRHCIHKRPQDFGQHTLPAGGRGLDTTPLRCGRWEGGAGLVAEKGRKEGGQGEREQ